MRFLALISLLVACTAWAEPEVGALLVVRRTGLTANQSRELETQLARGLEANGVNLKLKGTALSDALKRLGVKDTTACGGRRSCASEVATQLGLSSVVTVSFSRLDAQTAVALEWAAPNAAPDAPLTKHSFVVPAGAHELTPELEPFAARLKTTLAPPAPRVDDTPRVTTPEPNLTPTPVATVTPVAVTAPPAPPSHAPALVLGGVGAASLLAGVALVVVSAVTRGPVNTSTTQTAPWRTSPLTEAQAVELNGTANTELGVGLGLGVAGAGLLTGALVAW